MMVMGMRGMTDAMNRIHMGLWAISSAPLMVGSDLTRISPQALSLLENKEALAIHDDSYGLQPVKVAQPAPGVQAWVKPLAAPGKRALALLNSTDQSVQMKIDWTKLGLDGAPRTLHDAWNGHDLSAPDTTFSIPARDLLLLIVNGQDKKPDEYLAQGSDITRIQATHAPTFARLHYANTSGHVAIVRVKSTSGLSTGLALPPTSGSNDGSVELILPKGTADLSFESQSQPVAIRKLSVYAW